jgi:hypothetical protein
MSDSNETMNIWVSLYIEGQPKEIGLAKVTMAKGADIYDLKKAIKEENSKHLEYCDAMDLVVYPPGTSVPIRDSAEAIDAGESVTDISTSSKRIEGDANKPGPLIVVAPPKPMALQSVADRERARMALERGSVFVESITKPDEDIEKSGGMQVMNCGLLPLVLGGRLLLGEI